MKLTALLSRKGGTAKTSDLLLQKLKAYFRAVVLQFSLNRTWRSLLVGKRFGCFDKDSDVILMAWAPT